MYSIVGIIGNDQDEMSLEYLMCSGVGWEDGREYPRRPDCFCSAEKHRRWMLKTNMLERLHEEINRKTHVTRLFPNKTSLLRLVRAIKIDED